MINSGKYNRQVTMLCPTCGGDQFEHEAESPNIKCASCGLETTKQALIDQNSENISSQVDAIGKEVVKDVAAELRKAFSGNKYIKIK